MKLLVAGCADGGDRRVIWMGGNWWGVSVGFGSWNVQVPFLGERIELVWRGVWEVFHGDV